MKTATEPRTKGYFPEVYHSVRILAVVCALILSSCATGNNYASDYYVDMVKKGVDFLKQEEYKEAIKAWEAAQAANPNSDAIAFNLGIAEEKLYNYAKAAYWYEKAYLIQVKDGVSKSSAGLTLTSVQAARNFWAAGEMDKANHYAELGYKHYREVGYDSLNSEGKPDKSQSNKIAAESAKELLDGLQSIPLKPVETPVMKSGPANKKYVNSLGMEFVYIPKGEFIMSDVKGVKQKTALAEGYWLQTTEVTQEQWNRIMGTNPSIYHGRNNPVEGISWDDTQKFIQKLIDKEKTNKYRLPTAAEWQYAAQAGTGTEAPFGSDKDKAGQYEWFNYNSGKRTNPVATRHPNQWGLYDMLGNVSEWVQDARADGKHFDLGGTCYGEIANLSSSNYHVDHPSTASFRDTGFRIVFSASFPSEEDYWYQKAKESDSLDDIKAYFKKYPAGKYRDQAKKLSEKIEADLKEIISKLEKDMVFVKGGCYQMGNTFGDIDITDAKPVHEVCVEDFWIGKYEVTQRQWQKVMGSNPSGFNNGDNYPVENISWDDAQEFLKKLSGMSGKGYRLPTEAEWEYAASSGGKAEKYSGGNDIDSVAWYDKNSDKQTHPVGQKKPNGLGIYDMNGNVWEWVQDWYGEKYYGESPKDNPKGPSSGQKRVLRGGSWFHTSQIVRVSCRNWGKPAFRSNKEYGLRVAFSSK
ncbi:MAG: SUMF1/EgtB/PvdO family nonheme iron enzyme [Nitrospirae bacterium]|nr:SUMF1/EgtB/PvdO family nonheme iron enzyme [Nitrospirota bacterium]